jgi:hypothetical protein
MSKRGDCLKNKGRKGRERRHLDRKIVTCLHPVEEDIIICMRCMTSVSGRMISRSEGEGKKKYMVGKSLVAALSYDGFL